MNGQATYSVFKRYNKYDGMGAVLQARTGQEGVGKVVAVFPYDREGVEAANEAAALCNTADNPEDRQAAEQMARDAARGMGR